MTNKKPEKKKEKSKTILVFAGGVSLKGNVRGTLFYEISDEDLEKGRLPKDAKERAHSNKLSRRVGRPGSVWEVEMDPDDSDVIFTDSFRFIGQWPDEEQLLRWQAENDAWETAQRAARTEKEEKNRNLVAKQLEPLRTSYRALKGGRPAKSAFLAHVITYIQG